MERASCRGMPLDMFYEPYNSNILFWNRDVGKPTIQDVCSHCPVRIDCRLYAIANRIKDGIWGGMFHYERVKFANTYHERYAKRINELREL